MKHIKTLKIDIDKKNFEVIPSVQYDSNTRFLHIQLLNNSVPCDITGCSVILSGVKEDGTSIFNSCDVINPEIAFIQAEITEQMNVIPGLIDCEIKIYDGEGVLTSKKFTIKVTASQTSRSVVSSNEFKALTDALNKVQAIDSKAEKAEVEKLTSQLDTKANKNEIFTMANMGQDIKEAMSGGSVAVVGKDTVLTENIVDKQVNYRKTNFMELDTKLNLFDGIYENIAITGSGPLKAIKSNINAKTAVIKIKPNTTYSVIKDKQSRFNLGTATRLMDIETGENLNGSVIMPLGNSVKTCVTFTTGDNDKYLYVNVTIDGVDVFLQIVEGQQNHLTVDNYTLKFTKDVSVYSKSEVMDMLSNINITADNTTFFEADVINLAANKTVFRNRRIGNSPPAVYISSTENEGSCVAMIKIEPNKTYSIILNDTDLVYKEKKYFKFFTSSERYSGYENEWSQGINIQYQPTNGVLNRNFVSGENDRYLYIYYTDIDKYHDFTVCEGIATDVKYNPRGINVYNKEEVDNKIIDKHHADFIVMDNNINLYTGMKLENKRIGGDIRSGICLESASTSDVYIVPVEPNKTYSIITKDTDLSHNEKKYIKIMTCNKLYTSNDFADGSKVYVEYSEYIQTSGSHNKTFTTGENAQYVYMYLFTKSLPEELKVFQVVEGSQSELTINSMDDCYVFEGVSCYPKHKVYNKDEINSLMEGTTKSNTFIKNGEVCDILLNNKVGYRLEHKTTSSINLNTWMLTKGTVGDVTLWSGSDIEAPIKEKGTADFIGGVHGDEIFETVEIVCDGVLLDLNQNYNITFKNLTVFVKSTLYRCGTNIPAFTRYKKLEFIGDELLVSNKLICLVDNFLVERHTGCGLYSVYKDLLLGYSVNTKPELIKDGGQGNNANMDIGTFYGEGFTITLKTVSGKTDTYKGSVADFKNESRPRYKLYFDCINSSSGYQLNTNDELNTCFSITIL